MNHWTLQFESSGQSPPGLWLGKHWNNGTEGKEDAAGSSQVTARGPGRKGHPGKREAQPRRMGVLCASLCCSCLEVEHKKLTDCEQSQTNYLSCDSKMQSCSLMILKETRPDSITSHHQPSEEGGCLKICSKKV